MSFHQDLVTQLQDDLAGVLSLPAEAIYTGDRPQKITRQGLEVWIEAGPGGTSLAGALRTHPYTLHVRLKTRRESNLTGADEIAQVKRAIEALEARYDGARPFAANLPSLLAVQAEGSSVSVDPDSGVFDGSLQLQFLEA